MSIIELLGMDDNFLHRLFKALSARTDGPNASEEITELTGTETVAVFDGETHKHAPVSALGGGVGYLSYVAVIAQSGDSNPVATPRSNNTGRTVTWVAEDAGNVVAQISGDAISPDRIVVFVQPGMTSGFANVLANVSLNFDSNAVQIMFATAENGVDSSPELAFVEIRVYPPSS